MYQHVLRAANVGPGTTLLDCGCGAGRFVHLAAQHGADVAGIDAAAELVEIAIRRSPRADLRVGDFEALPWPDRSFDVVTGFSTFQFADDHARALGEARRVSRGPVWVVIPTRLAESGIPQVFAPLMALFPPPLLPALKRSGMFALSAPGKLDEVLAAVGLRRRRDDTLDATVVFPDAPTAVAAFLSAGATALALRHGDPPAVEKAVRDALDPFIGDLGQVTLPGWFRVVETTAPV
ncbi:MAG TPA: class I SAM-dependent methyltransferase [Pilimelia sp.]|nr:class I SAM-dependent methyltransferase [Pilimelia sp.]